MGLIHPSEAFDPEAPVLSFRERFPRFRADPYEVSEMFAFESGDAGDFEIEHGESRTLSGAELVETRRKMLAEMASFTGDSITPTPYDGERVS